MKKLTILVITGISIISLSAHANPPLADGKWVGTYTTQTFNSACSGVGKAILIQKGAKNVEKGVTAFSGTLILENFQGNNSYPDYSKGVAAETKIVYSIAFNTDPGTASINETNYDSCKYEFQQAGNYDDIKKEIHGLLGGCECRIKIVELHYQPSVAKPASSSK